VEEKKQWRIEANYLNGGTEGGERGASAFSASRPRRQELAPRPYKKGLRKVGKEKQRENVSFVKCGKDSPT